MIREILTNKSIQKTRNNNDYAKYSLADGNVLCHFFNEPADRYMFDKVEVNKLVAIELKEGKDNQVKGIYPSEERPSIQEANVASESNPPVDKINIIFDKSERVFKHLESMMEKHPNVKGIVEASTLNTLLMSALRTY